MTADPPAGPAAPVEQAGGVADSGVDAAPAEVAARAGWVAPVAVTALVLAIPLLVALVVLRQPQWYPPGDLAQTELRVRDVWSSHPPAIGLPGRIGSFGEQQGSHPGPLSFYVLFPAYRLLGAGSWAFLASGFLWQAAALTTALWIAHRRAGRPLLLGLAAALALLFQYYGTLVMIEPWNPYLPVLAWLVFLLALWSVLEGDLPLLPVAVFAGSFCAQTHIPYLGLTVGLGTSGIVAAFAFARARERAGETDALRHFRRWALIAGGVALLLWSPPVIEQLTASHGNLGVIREHFSDPPEPPIGIASGAKWLLINLNPLRLVAERWDQNLPEEGDSVVPGALLLLAWGASAVTAWRLALHRLRRLNLVLGVALVFAVMSLSRIFGTVYPYLMMWAWAITALLLVALGWTVTETVRLRLDPAPARLVLRGGCAVLALTALASTARFTADTARMEMPNPMLSRTLVDLAPATVDALSQDAVPGGGRRGRYLLTWVDPFALNGRGYALLLELERRGFDVGVSRVHRNGAGPHRVMEPTEATAELHVAIGPDIDAWRQKGAEEIVSLDFRTEDERTEYDTLRADVIRRLHDRGLDDLVPSLDGNLFASVFDTRVTDDLRTDLNRLMNLSLLLPTAVFVAPPQTA